MIILVPIMLESRVRKLAKYILANRLNLLMFYEIILCLGKDLIRILSW